MSADPFRYCVYCEADCYADEPEHDAECPSNTGLYPVTTETLGMRGPDDPYAFGARCMDCGVEFKLGDTYTHREVADDVREMVCVGCRVLNPEPSDV